MRNRESRREARMRQHIVIIGAPSPEIKEKKCDIELRKLMASSKRKWHGVKAGAGYISA